MRKTLAVLLLLACLLTAAFMVGCEKKVEAPATEPPAAEPPAFSGSFFDALTQMKTAGTVTFESNGSSYGTFLTTVTYDDVTIFNDNANQKYIGVFVNTDDVAIIDLYGMCDPVVYGGETYNYSGVGVDAINYVAGLKVLIAFTVEKTPGAYTYVAEKGSALLFTLPDAAAKVTLD